MNALRNLEPLVRAAPPSTWSSEVDALAGGLAGLQRTLAVAVQELRQVHRAYERLVQLAAAEQPTADGGCRAAPDRLTAQERRVAVLIGLGKTDRDVARLLQLSVHTVKSHVKNILRKRGMHSRWQMHGLLGAEAISRLPMPWPLPFEE